jgi:hypothetical protein
MRPQSIQTSRMKCEDNRHRQLIDSIDIVTQTVEDSNAFAQGKKPVERHPFLTGLFGPSIVRKLFGR